MILRIVETPPPLVGDRQPVGADHDDHHLGPSDRLLESIRPALAGPQRVDVAEHLIVSERLLEAIMQPTGVPAAVAPPVAEKDPVGHDPRSSAGILLQEPGMGDTGLEPVTSALSR